MIYKAYDTFQKTTDPIRRFADHTGRLLNEWSSAPFASPLQKMAAYYELLALLEFTHERPSYEIGPIETPAGLTHVSEEVVYDAPFGSLLRFRKANLAPDEPKVLLIAPMSGHFATLLRATVRTLLRDHDVYITDWRNARDVPLSDGAFGLEPFIAAIITFVGQLGPDSHIVAVCQPTVPALAATAVMAERKDPNQPASLTLMAGPIDTRINPTKVNDLATGKPIDWFASKMIGIVPDSLGGAGRRVYPGFLQLSAFMGMNLERHSRSFADMLRHRINGDSDKADAIKTFYQEYFAIMDLPGEFYLETVELVFQKFLLARNALTYEGQLVRPQAIKRTFLLTVEGERDDICAVGQTLAAHDLCSGLRPFMKSHHLQPGVGHYGVFSGSRWDRQIYPVVRNLIRFSV